LPNCIRQINFPHHIKNLNFELVDACLPSCGHGVERFRHDLDRKSYERKNVSKSISGESMSRLDIVYYGAIHVIKNV